VHFFQQFFTGPAAPGTLQPRELVKRLGAKGNRVEVIAGNLNAYNEQEEPPEELLFEGGGRVIVSRVMARKGFRGGLAARLQTYLGYSARAWSAARKLGRPDVVVGSIQPLFTGLVAIRHARKHSVPFLLEVRDLWPDALVAKGALSRWQAAPLEWMARLLYDGADRIVCLTPGLKVELLKKGVSPGKVDIFTNGLEPASYDLPPGTREEVRERLGWGQDFVAVYVGSHVEVTAIDVIVRAAAELRERQGIRIDLFGQGQRKAAAIALARDLGLRNIHFHDPVPKAEVPRILAAADAGLMTLFESPLIHIYFENKFVDYLGAALPIVAAMGGEQAELIRRHGLGRVTRAFDHAGLARLILEAASDLDGRRSAGERGRRFARERLFLPDIVERYSVRIEAVAAGAGSSLPPWDPFA
jgi:glycosyltransferase involved in cell wall biosynthesis